MSKALNFRALEMHRPSSEEVRARDVCSSNSRMVRSRRSARIRVVVSKHADH
jgi:hypothetical protein